MQAWASRPKSPARDTSKLLDLLQRLQPGTSLSPDAIRRGFGRFPVAGPTWYQDDWGAPRGNPSFAVHEGVDLFAPGGTPAIACASGVIQELMNGTIGGISIWLAGDDGFVYYYGHLRGYAPGLVAGKRVRIGDVIAFVGNTGNAKDTDPHVHFEIRPKNGATVAPKPFVDSWLDAAIARAAALLKPRPSPSPSRIEPAPLGDQELGDGVLVPFWTSALDPSAAGLGLAEQALERIASASASGD